MVKHVNRHLPVVCQVVNFLTLTKNDSEKKDFHILLVNKYFQKGILELQKMKTLLMEKRETLCLQNNLSEFKCREYLRDFYQDDNKFLRFIDESLSSFLFKTCNLSNFFTNPKAIFSKSLSSCLSSTTSTSQVK